MDREGSMIAEIPEKYELTIGYSWHSNNSQGMCGHLFEMIEYYHILKNHFSVCMMMCDNMMQWERIESTIRDKYDFTDVEILDIRNNMVFFDCPRIVKGKSLLLVDGNFSGMSGRFLYFKNIMAFPCRDLKFQTMDNITVFQDDRIYGVGHNTVNYIKKILFSRYKKIGDSEDNKLVYATSNTKWLKVDFYDELSKTYDGDFLLLSDKRVEGISDRFKQESMPVKNLFERFNTYIYTPTTEKKDCSPRFPAECRFYGKGVEYFKIDYMDRDLGLCFRRYDIENDFDGLFLREDDSIIGLIGDII